MLTPVCVSQLPHLKFPNIIPQYTMYCIYKADVGYDSMRVDARTTAQERSYCTYEVTDFDQVLRTQLKA